MQGQTKPDGARAGLAVFGHAYAFVGLERRGDADVAILVTSPELATETVVADAPCAGPLRLRITTDADAVATLSASAAGDELLAPTPFQATEAHWIGSDLCLFGQRPVGTAPASATFTGWRLTRR